MSSSKQNKRKNIYAYLGSLTYTDGQRSSESLTDLEVNFPKCNYHFSDILTTSWLSNIQEATSGKFCFISPQQGALGLHLNYSRDTKIPERPY